MKIISELFINKDSEFTFVSFSSSHSLLADIHTVKSQATDPSTIQLWNFLAKGQST